MDWLGLLSFRAAKDPELAPHSYLLYLLLWTFLVGFFVLFISNTTDLMLWWAVILSGCVFDRETINQFNKRSL